MGRWIGTRRHTFRLTVHSWMIEIKGNKLAPRVQKSLPGPVADENYHTPDEAVQRMGLQHLRRRCL